MLLPPGPKETSVRPCRESGHREESPRAQNLETQVGNGYIVQPPERVAQLGEQWALEPGWCLNMRTWRHQGVKWFYSQREADPLPDTLRAAQRLVVTWANNQVTVLYKVLQGPRMAVICSVGGWE